jgi:monovalent cation/hydrogen antiporter
MPGTGLHGAELILLLLLLFVVAFAALAQRLATPYPIVLVIAGLLVGFVPGMPKIELKPDVIFFVILPPLLYSAALGTAWDDFRHNLINIAFLAIGLVGFTVLGVAGVGPLLLPGFDWRLRSWRSGGNHRLYRRHVHRKARGAAQAHCRHPGRGKPG